jgi:hypothetical protein
LVSRCEAIERLAATLRDGVGVDSSIRPHDGIGTTQRILLIAAYKLKAIDHARARPLRVIIGAAGCARPQARNIVNAVEGLKHRGLMDAVRGNNGGHWITRAGLEIATAP